MSNIIAALTQAITAVADERETHDGMLDTLTRRLLDAVTQHNAGDTSAAHASCREALDLAYDALGTCEDVEPLTALLGYVEPEPN